VWRLLRKLLKLLHLSDSQKLFLVNTIEEKLEASHPVAVASGMVILASLANEGDDANTYNTSYSWFTPTASPIWRRISKAAQQPQSLLAFGLWLVLQQWAITPLARELQRHHSKVLPVNSI